MHVPFKFHQIWGWSLWRLDQFWLPILFQCLFFTFSNQMPDGRVTLTHSFQGWCSAGKNTQEKKPLEQLLNWINKALVMVTPKSRAILPEPALSSSFRFASKWEVLGGDQLHRSERKYKHWLEMRPTIRVKCLCTVQDYRGPGEIS